MGQVRQRMLVVVAVMGGVRVAVVDVVGVTLALGAGVPAAGPVVVGVVGWTSCSVAGHGSSLL